MTGDDRPVGASWKARPWGARLVHALAVLAPVSAGACAAIVLGSRLPGSSSVTGVVVRVLFVVAASTAVVLAVDRVARRLLPLAALYRLSLVFPDRAPSRFRSALKAGSSRRVARTIAQTRQHGLPADPGAAACRVVELIGAIGDHDRRTRGHSERVRLYADLIGEEMRLPKEDRQKLQWAALLHDLGKLMVPAEILNKKGAPTGAEWAVLGRHPAEGERLVTPLRPFLGTWADAVGGHHEWWNGKGYPRQLRGAQISNAAAIVAVADAYEVMISVRSYKKPMPASAARAELTRSAGVQFSPEVVRAFLCISLGKLRVAAGPAASLAQIPFLGTATRFPAAVGTAMQGARAMVAVAAPAVAASAIVATSALVNTSTTTPLPQRTRGVLEHRVTTPRTPTLPGNTLNRAAPVANHFGSRRNGGSLHAITGVEDPTTTTKPASPTTTTSPAYLTTTTDPASPTTTTDPASATTTTSPATSPTTEHRGDK